MNTLQVSPQAKQDLHDIRSYITDELQNPTVAVNVITQITKKIRSLMDFPLIGTPLPAIVDIETDYRFLVCGNYTVFYRYDDTIVYVVRVLYGRRNFMKILFGGVTENDSESTDL